MTDCTKRHLEEINEVSRQLLSRILAAHADSQTNPQGGDLENPEGEPAKKESDDIAKLTEKRHTLITQLFERNTPENISAESDLIEKMVALNNKLTANAKLCKQAITEQLIKIKKSNKVTKSYQKY
ncbi:MAG: hypothetical protein COB45_04575 [Gammaproteobacteria bacterium]|nr:MAG: hypothetical protein COB45_04575 [Gammaproteobacteria bacterium]PHR81482.1 MAG: hypothetical protein COA59_15955 [Colwellia sp.]